MPLRTIESFASSQPVSGCAFASVTAPCVAQRVWPSPVTAAEPSLRPARSFRFGERPDGARVLERAVGEERDAGRVVAAVLEALEPGEQQLLTRPAGRRTR